MSVPLVVNGVTYNYPVQGDTNWGPVLTAWSTAVTNALSVISGGNASFLTITSLNASPATTGFLRLANTDAIEWRNFANTGNLPLAVNSSNQLTFNGVPIGASAALTNSHIFVGNVSNQPADVAMSGDTTITNAGVVTISNSAITDVKVSATAAIALSKLAPTTAYYWYVANGAGVLTPLAVTPSRAVVTDTNGSPVAATTTATEIGFVNGVTSAIQPQINSKVAKAGDTMSGTLNLGSNKIISLANGTNVGDAVNFGQLPQLSIPYARGIKVSYQDINKNHLLWTDAVLEDTSGNKIRNSTPTILNIFTTASGANGLDTGTVAANSFYFIWIISNGSTFAGLYSLSNTSPTMPSGYTYKIKVGCIGTDASANIYPSLQVGQYVHYQSIHTLVSDSTNNNGSTIVQSAGAFVPLVEAWRLFIEVGMDAVYSDAANHNISFLIGLFTGGATPPPQVFSFTAKTPVNGTYLNYINVTNELPEGPQFGWIAQYDATNLSAFVTVLSVAGYQLTNFSIT